MIEKALSYFNEGQPVAKESNELLLQEIASLTQKLNKATNQCQQVIV
jgi:hypothetical protein